MSKESQKESQLIQSSRNSLVQFELFVIRRETLMKGIAEISLAEVHFICNKWNGLECNACEMRNVDWFKDN